MVDKIVIFPLKYKDMKWSLFVISMPSCLPRLPQVFKTSLDNFEKDEY